MYIKEVNKLSMQLYLYFETKEKFIYAYNKYKWNDEMIEMLNEKISLCPGILCAYYGNDVKENYGIGGINSLAYSMLGSSLNPLGKCITEYQTDRMLTIDHMQLSYMRAINTLDSMLKWIHFINENIFTLHTFGFLLHWDVDDDFSNVAVLKKKYTNITPYDLLGLRENILLIIECE